MQGTVLEPPRSEFEIIIIIIPSKKTSLKDPKPHVCRQEQLPRNREIPLGSDMRVHHLRPKLTSPPPKTSRISIRCDLLCGLCREELLGDCLAPPSLPRSEFGDTIIIRSKNLAKNIQNLMYIVKSKKISPRQGHHRLLGLVKYHLSVYSTIKKYTNLTPESQECSLIKPTRV